MNFSVTQIPLIYSKVVIYSRNEIIYKDSSRHKILCFCATTPDQTAHEALRYAAVAGALLPIGSCRGHLRFVSDSKHALFNSFTSGVQILSYHYYGDS